MVLLNTERVTNDKEILSSALLESDFVFIFSLADGVYVTPPRAPCLSTETSGGRRGTSEGGAGAREKFIVREERESREGRDGEKWRKFRSSRGTRGNWCILQAHFATRRGRASSACLEERFYRRRSRGKGDDRRPCK